jgi:molecular chaperone GrpE
LGEGSRDYPAHKDDPSPSSGEVPPGTGPESQQPTAPDEASIAVEINNLRNKVHRLQKEMADKDAQLSKVMDAYRRLKSETGKARERIEKSQKKHLEKSKNEFIGQFVEVLDNLDRAIDSIENNFDSDSVLQGIILMRSRLVSLLRQEGLEKIFVGGQPFDPTHSEAAAIEPVDDEAQDNIVLSELQRGYMLRGALLRPARVVVGRFEGPRTEPPRSPESLPDNDNSFE